MKHRNFIFAVMALPVVLFSMRVAGQTPYVKQVITANGGQFEYTPPFQDFATVQTFNPASGAVNIFGQIGTQSVQDVCISGHYAFIAAQDSLVKFDLNTLERVAAIADSGLNKLYIYKDKLVVTKQYPLSIYFVEILDTADLSLVESVAGIPGDCGGAVAVGDTIYVTVNGGWMGTDGKIAVISAADWTLTRIINLGTEAIGAFNIYYFDKKLFTINKSPYATPNTGSISMYDLSDHSVTNTVLGVNIGNGSGISGNLLYLALNYGIGSFNMNTLQIEDTVIVSDPGSGVFRYILSSAIDTLNDVIYVNIGDYVTAGTCLVTSLAGDSITSFATGISSDAVAVDYRIAPTGFGDDPDNNPLSLTVFPNPATDFITVRSAKGEEIPRIVIRDITGREVYRQPACGSGNTSARISLRTLLPGYYFMTLERTEQTAVISFIKQ